jgi:hypothetical protein
MSDDYDYGDDAGKGFDPDLKLTPRDCANVLLGPIEIDMQLLAIRSLLQRNRAEDARLLTELEEIERRARSLTGWANEFASDDYGEALYRTVYQDGTHALAALGLVAPLIESVLIRLFRYVPRMVDPATPRHPRWDAIDAEKKWNCKFRLDEETGEWKEDVIGGVNQLAKVLVPSYLGRNDRRRLEALFRYRNNMFHNGMEWPEDKATAFDKFAKECPAGWFTSARRGDRPWIFYMTGAFTDDCLALLARFTENVGTIFIHWNQRTGLSLYDLMRENGP